MRPLPQPAIVRYDFLVIGGVLVTEIIIGAILIILTAALAEKVQPNLRKWLWTLFLIFVIGQATLQIMRVRQERSNSELSEQAQQELKRELDQSLLNQQYTKGQLDSLSLTVGHLGQPSAQSEALADGIRQMAHASAQKAADLTASNRDLCARARELGNKIRHFEEEFQEMRKLEAEQYRQQMVNAKTEAERIELFRQQGQQEIQEEQAHEAAFRSNYISEAKYLHDLLLTRIPPQTAADLLRNNEKADIVLTISSPVGVFSEYVTATYLDELANAVCGTKK